MSKQRKYLTQGEVEQLLAAALQGSMPERDYCLIYMSFVHGFRVSEVRHLTLSDLDMKEGYLPAQAGVQHHAPDAGAGDEGAAGVAEGQKDDAGRRVRLAVLIPAGRTAEPSAHLSAHCQAG